MADLRSRPPDGTRPRGTAERTHHGGAEALERGLCNEFLVKHFEQGQGRQLGQILREPERQGHVAPAEQGEAEPPRPLGPPAAEGADDRQAQHAARQQEHRASPGLGAALQGRQADRQDQDQDHQPPDREANLRMMRAPLGAGHLRCARADRDSRPPSTGPARRRSRPRSGPGGYGRRYGTTHHSRMRIHRPSLLIRSQPSFTTYARPSCRRQRARDVFRATPSRSIWTVELSERSASCRPMGSA